MKRTLPPLHQRILKETPRVSHVSKPTALRVQRAMASPLCVLEGDALSSLKMLPDGVIQSVVTSPPYWGVRDYGVPGQIGMEPTVESYIARLVRVFSQLKRVLREDGAIWVNVGDVYASGNRSYRAGDTKYPQRAMSSRPATPRGLKPKDLVGVPWQLAFALQRDGWYLRGEIIWQKTNAMPESVRDRPWRSHEYLFLLTKSEKYRFDFAKLAVEGDALKRSVWSMAAGRSRVNGHSAVFPERLVAPCIAATSRKRGLVLDPFCGTGTVGAVCARLGRKFVGVEISPIYAEAAVRKLRHVSSASNPEK